MVRSESVIKIVPGERYTPFSLASALGVRCILESSSFQKGRERYSVLLVKEAFQLFQDPRGVIFRRTSDSKEFRVESRARDLLDVSRYFADQHAPVNQDFPFPAGGIGFLSYEFSRYCDNIHIANQDEELGLPEAAFIFGHIFIIFDHYTDLLYLIGLNYAEAQIDLDLELAELESMLLSGTLGTGGQEKNALPALELSEIQDDEVPGAQLIAEASDEEEAYMQGVEAVRQEIIAGNLLQGVLSRRLTFYSHVNPLEAYRKLRSANPSPYLFYLDFGSYQLFGSSPEVHVKSRYGKTIVRPIAGTRRRGVSRSDDLSLEAELLADPKERAEHLMLVDLGRNDLGRVCKPGSVKVTEYMVVERYSHVMHIVSQVEGELSDGKSGIDAFRATFPAGTVSGAPKIRAMEILSRLEPRRRRFYAGAVGYIEPGGNLDTCIGIRCALKIGKKLVLQAGAGIVFDSTPERELEETREKMAGVLRAVGIDPEEAMKRLEYPDHEASNGTVRKQSADVKDSVSGRFEEDPDVSISLGYAAAGGRKPLSAKNTAAPGSSFRSGAGLQDRVDSIVEENNLSKTAIIENDLMDEMKVEILEDVIPVDLDWDASEAKDSSDIQSDIDVIIKEEANGRDNL